MTRDPNRIKPILEQLETLWLKHPEMRLGQLISNFAIEPKKWASKEDSDVYLALCNANHVPPKEFEGFVEDY